MPEHVVFPTFRDEQRDSKYPFADTASLTTQDGLRTISADMLLDASLYPIGAAARLYLSEIQIASREVIFQFSDPTGQALCSGSFDPLDPPYVITCEDPVGRPAGVLLAEPLQLTGFATWPIGTHTFRLGATELVAGVVIPTPEPGLRGILTKQGELLTGDVWLVGDRGIVLRKDGDGVIRVDAVGDPLYRRRLCLIAGLFEPPRLITTINGCPPDELGNFNLTVGDHIAADTVVRVYPTDEGLKIERVGPLLQG